MTLFSTRAIIRKIAAIDIIFTTLKSWSVVSIISFIQGASPMSIPFLSYFFRIWPRLSISRLTSSLATLYSELIRSSCHLSPLSNDLTDLGRISSGTFDPRTDSSPRTYLTPSTSSISFIIERTSLSGTLLSTSNMCVDAISKSSLSLLFAITYSMSFGSESPIS